MPNSSTTGHSPFHPTVASILRIWESSATGLVSPPATGNRRGVICPGDSGIISGDALSQPVPCAERDWTEEIWIQSCKTSNFDHDNHFVQARECQPLTLKIGHVMDATDLKAFEAVARLGSMNRPAAE